MIEKSRRKALRQDLVVDQMQSVREEGEAGVLGQACLSYSLQAAHIQGQLGVQLNTLVGDNVIYPCQKVRHSAR